jgi:DNA polymerase-3 subunit alpha (Gram-positive type)
MQDKLKILLDKLNISEEQKQKFENATLDKIVGNKTRDKYQFFMTFPSNLEVDVFLNLKKELRESFQEFDEIGLQLTVKEEDLEKLPEYYVAFLNIKLEQYPLLSMSLENKIEKEENKLVIEVSNKAEQLKLTGIERDLLKFLEEAGYSFEKVSYRIDEEKSKQLQTEIEALKEKVEVKEVEKTEEIIKGREIKGNITKIADILYEEPNVVVEAKIFDIEEKELTNFTLFSVKITDGTDSIFGNIFVKKDAADELQTIKKRVKKGSWYRMRGKVQNDNFKHELVLSVYDVTWIKKEEEQIIDNADIKRVELHAHTMMSQMDGVTKLDLGKHTCELVERTIAMGYKGVAITDHNGCQAFPISFGIIKSHNKKVRGKIKAEIEELETKIGETKDQEELQILEKELKEKKEKAKNPPIFKGLYGTELTLVDDTVNIVVRPTDDSLMDNTYVVFDTETTGFNAGGADQMIEIGAVKLRDGVIVDRFDELIDPKRHIPDKITELTCITDEMVKGKNNEEEVTKKFLEWTGNLPMVAHNAKFDISFLEMAMKKYNLGTFKNTVIDTLELSRTLDQEYSRHSLSALVKRYNVPWEEDAHHRADYDAEGTALVFHKMLLKLKARSLEKISDLDKLISKDEIYKFGRTFHFNAIALNKKGLKNLFTIISLANTEYLYKTPRILRSKLNELREGLLIGSGCYESEVFTEARSKEGEELTNIIDFYDYVEVQPPEVYGHLIQLGDFKTNEELKNHILKIIHATKETGKMIVATGDVHHFTREDKIYREIIINQKVPGGGRHPLAKKDIKTIPSQHFRTTNEMLEDFNFLDKDLAYEIVVTNTNKICDMVEEIEVIPDTGGTPFSPRVKSDDGETYLDCPRVVTDLVYTKARDWYGEPLPYSIEERIATELYGDIVLNCIKKELSDLEGEELNKEAFRRLHEVILKGCDDVKALVRKHIKEENEENVSDEEVEAQLKKKLGGVIGAGFDPIYLIAQRLVKHSNDEGFLVGSRGSVGSSFVATMMGITEVNPLSAHYRCSKCKMSIFEDENGNSLGAEYSSGFDLPDKMCPNCNIPLLKDGQDMPFATFLGFNADKVPDIDLNFSDLNQASTHAYTKVLFGPDNVYRAGTIGTVADKTAFGFVKGYCEEKGITMRTAEVERLAAGCTGVKRTTGQHPGGIVVIPDYMDCFDFTPFQFPAEDPTKAWRTTHFDYHSIEECVLKLDILGHSDPTQLRLIQLQSGTDIMKVPMDDKATMSIFTSTEALGVTKEQIMCNTGTLGIPEFGTPFTIQLVEDTKPTTFAELVKISGLSHGTDVWLGNAQELIKNNIVPFKETIGCRDDIMVYLMYRGLPPIKSFKIMEFVRKGKASKDPVTWAEHKKTMEEADIPDWFIDSCQKIKYMFPKAHAAAYVISAFRIAWYKVHMPVYFYASWFSSKATDVDVETMIKGYDTIKNQIVAIQNKGYEATNKENGQLESLKVALEATARGIKFLNIDLYNSEATVWKAVSDHEVLPPFNAIDGLGDVAAEAIVAEREKRRFLSIEDLQKRGRVSQTLIEKMKSMGILDGMDESAQLTLF